MPIHSLTMEHSSSSEDGETQESPPDMYQQREQSIIQTLLYLFVDLARRESAKPLGRKLRDSLRPFESKLLMLFTNILVKTRWDDLETPPPLKILQLYWKTVLLVFGGMSDIERIKAAFDKGNDSNEKETAAGITASPLDYHVFRQEIISKYPAYDPPPALFPFESDNNSFLPPLQEVLPKNGPSTQNFTSVGPANILGAGTSILNQPVHIATPAPSPPPSPAGPGGKGLKKQNYQTNQMFPFLYPPLDESSNDLGGKGTTELQDLLAGKKWHGSDVPASILEAADLFAMRMRATRVMKQLWEERVRFMMFEQGYGSLDSVNGQEVPLNLENGNVSNGETDDYTMLDDDMRQRLGAVEAFYEDVLPRLQSVVIVLLKTLVQTITTLITQTEGLEAAANTNGAAKEPSGDSYHDEQADIASNFKQNEAEEDPTFHELTIIRNQEIIGKAVSGILILLLKWFKVSHILKFEYLSQLLLDSNFIQFILKLFAHQELDRAVSYRCERKDLNFFRFCVNNSRNANAASTTNEGSDDDIDEDDAAPPPIRLNRQQGSKTSLPSMLHYDLEADNQAKPPTPAPTQPPPNPPPPEVDELGYPISDIPLKPITHFSWRSFFTSINYLRILQKIIKAKPHRQLLMVQGKYSNTLKKHLKVPQSDVRLYTLKIIKGQVPYCHRKWRQSNMRIITAIYLHVKPGLRDEWLSGLDVEQEVGEALPAEQALRALTYWYNLRRYPAQMGMAESASVSPSALALPPGIAGKFSEDFIFSPESEFVGRANVVEGAQSLEGIIANDEFVKELDQHNYESSPPAGSAADDNPQLPIFSINSTKHEEERKSASPGPPSIQSPGVSQEHNSLIISTSLDPDTDSETESKPSMAQHNPIQQNHSSGSYFEIEKEPQSIEPLNSTTNSSSNSVPPLMLREQDFFLRELEKMDLGLSLPSPSASRSSSRHSSRPVSSSGRDDDQIRPTLGKLELEKPPEPERHVDRDGSLQSDGQQQELVNFQKQPPLDGIGVGPDSAALALETNLPSTSISTATSLFTPTTTSYLEAPVDERSSYPVSTDLILSDPLTLTGGSIASQREILQSSTGNDIDPNVTPSTLAPLTLADSVEDLPSTTTDTIPIPVQTPPSTSFGTAGDSDPGPSVQVVEVDSSETEGPNERI